MSKLRCHISVSLDGYVAGPNQSEENPLGEGGERLHDWAVSLAAWREAHAYHYPVFILTPHARRPVEMKGGTTFHFVTDGIALVPSKLRQLSIARLDAVLEWV
jgi:hypothetical protein